MSPHEDCSNWEYRSHPNKATVDSFGVAFLVNVRKDPSNYDPFLHDTRDTHGKMFEHVAPTLCPYVAGNYRGADFPCLQMYRVGIDNQEGILPFGVKYSMQFFHEDLVKDIAAIDAVRSDPDNKIPSASLDLMLIETLALHMVKFLSIHPYANGNGHIGRMLMWIGLSRAKLWPKTWSVNTRPGWDELIRRHRAGNTKPLVKFVLKSI